MTHFIQKNVDLKEECRLYMSEVGLPLDTPIIADGRIKRYSADARKNKPDEWYVAYEGFSSRGNAYLNCVFGSWSEGSQYEYKSFDRFDRYDAHEKEELREIARVQRLKTEADIKESHNHAAKEAQKLWDGYSSTPPSAEYVQYAKAKGINLVGEIKFGLNPQGYPSMVIPLRNEQGEFRSLQYISADINKISYKGFFAGGEKKGNFHIIGDVTADEDSIFIAEGYATAASVYEAISKPVVVAFDAGNLEVVIDNLRKRFSQTVFIIAADNDEVGHKKAKEAAAKFECTVIAPIFPKDKERQEYTDFNDLHQACGIDEARRQLLAAYSIDNSGQSLKTVAENYLAENEEPCAKFKLSKLPPQLREYIAFLCKATNAHPIMITASVLTMVSAYLGTKVYIAEGEYFQNLYANLWILCIAKSGQFKTTALNKGSKIAHDKQAFIFKMIKTLQEEAPGDDTQVQKEVLTISRQNIILPTKITAEAFLEYLAQGHQGAIYASEFGGWLQNLDKSHNNDFKAILTEFYDVPTYYRYKTKTQGDCIIERPYISICGVSTMPWVSSNIKPSDVPSGFFARFIIFTPPYQDEIPPALPIPVSEDHSQEENNFKTYLNHILENVGQGRAYIFSDDSRIIFDKLHRVIYAVPKAYSDKAEEILQPYLKRWSPGLLKLAMLIQLFIDPKTTYLSSEAIKIAYHILLVAMKSTAALFEGELGESEHQRKCRILFEWMCQKIKDSGKPIKRHTIISSKKLDGGSKDYDYVLQTLIDQGKIEYKELPKKNESEYSLAEQVEKN